ncbi:MAG: amidohydrolase family protein, partial [Burkholderiaceae bacterium]
PVAPRTAARSMFYDDLVYDAAGIAFLIQSFGLGQIMLGSDYPFAIMDKDPVGRVAALALDAAAQQALRQGNALRWLGRTPESP